MAKEIVSPVGAGLVVASSDYDRQFGLGDMGQTKDGGGAVFVQAKGSISVGHVLGISPDFYAYPLSTTEYNLGYAIGFAYEAASTNQYFWARTQPQGTVDILAAAACAPNVPLYVTTTAGVVDDAGTAGVLIYGLQANATAGATATVVAAVASYPRVQT